MRIGVGMDLFTVRRTCVTNLDERKRSLQIIMGLNLIWRINLQG